MSSFLVKVEFEYRHRLFIEYTLSSVYSYVELECKLPPCTICPAAF